MKDKSMAKEKYGDIAVESDTERFVMTSGSLNNDGDKY